MQQNCIYELILKSESTQLPLYQLLAEEIKRLIRTGKLRPGEALPGSRELSERLSVSRKTVVKAMDILVFSGWVLNRNRVGLFVTGVPNADSHSAARIVREMQTESKMNIDDLDVIELDIDDGMPDASLMPVADIKHSMHRILCDGQKWLESAYESPQGLWELREKLADVLREERSMHLTASEICVTRGCQMSLFLIANSILKRGDSMVMENPGNGRAYETFRKAGINVIPINIDNDGIRVLDLEDLLETETIRAVYITPRHQYPTTVTLSPIRRRQLAALAEERDFIVIEDDSCCHFQFSGQHLMPISCQLHKNHYLYISSFSTLLGPSVRMGFVASSYDMISELAECRSSIDRQGDVFMEQVILDLIEKDKLNRHIRRASKVYRDQLEYISDKIEERLCGRVVYHNPHGGLAIWIGFATTVEALAGLDIEDIKAKLLSYGVRVAVYKLPSGQVGIRVGYATMTRQQIDFLIDVLAKIV